MPSNKPRKTGPRSYKRQKTYRQYYGKSSLKPELKFLDTGVTAQLIPNAYAIPTSTFITIPEGTSDNERVGRKVVIQQIELKGQLTYTPSAQADGSNHVSMMIVLDTQCNGTSPPITDIMTNSVPARSYPNLVNQGRFKILKAWEVDFNVTNTESTIFVPSEQTKYIHFKKSVSIPIEYAGALGTLTNIKSNNLFIMYGCDGQNNTVRFDGKTRIRYVD